MGIAVGEVLRDIEQPSRRFKWRACPGVVRAVMNEDGEDQTVCARMLQGPALPVRSPHTPGQGLAREPATVLRFDATCRQRRNRRYDHA